MEKRTVSTATLENAKKELIEGVKEYDLHHSDDNDKNGNEGE